MATCLDIITDACREIGTLGTRSIDAYEGILGLRRLNTLLTDLSGMGIGERLRDVLLSDLGTLCAEEMPVNVRVLVDTSAALSFPYAPQNGSRFAVVDVENTFAASPVTIARNDRKVEGLASDYVANTAGMTREWFYRADLGDWRAVTTLALSDDFPLAADCEEAIAILLAVRLAPADGASVSQETGSAYQRALSTLKARHRQTVITRAPEPLLRMGAQAFGVWSC